MNIDPADASPVQAAIADERNDLGVRDQCRVAHLLVQGQKLLAAPSIANKQLPVDKLVANDLIATEERVQLGRIRRSIREESNPHRSVDKDHQATLRFDFLDGLSRRLGTSCA